MGKPKTNSKQYQQQEKQRKKQQKINRAWGLVGAVIMLGAVIYLVTIILGLGH